MVDHYGVDLKLAARKKPESPGVWIKGGGEFLYTHPFMLTKWQKQVREGGWRFADFTRPLHPSHSFSPIPHQRRKTA